MEKDLLLAFVSGDQEATEKFFIEYGGIVKYAVGKLVVKGNVLDKDDLFLETISYILDNKEKIVRSFKYKCKFSTYLYLICRRYAVKKLREEDNIPRSDIFSPSVEELPDSIIEEEKTWDEDTKKILPQVIEQLDENSQLFIKMHYFEKKSINDIMHIFGWNSPNSVYSKKNRIINKLRKNMRKLLKRGST